MPYGWNDAKAASNLAKHGVSFTAMARFDWATALVEADTRASYGEVRLVALGLIDVRLHALVFTIRAPRIWVISLRKASNKEIDRYEDQAQYP